MTPDVVAVKTMAGYLSNAAFADSEVRQFDMYPFLNPRPSLIYRTAEGCAIQVRARLQWDVDLV